MQPLPVPLRMALVQNSYSKGNIVPMETLLDGLCRTLINNNVVGVWTGTVTVMPQPNKVRIPVFTMHWILANGYTYNITSGFEQFAIVG